MADDKKKNLTLNRRRFLGAGLIAAAAAGMTKLASSAKGCLECMTDIHANTYPAVLGNGVKPNVAFLGGMPVVQPYQPQASAGMEPGKFLTHFDSGTVSTKNGRVVREFKVWAEDKDIEVAKGIYLPGWLFNGFLPGPTLRAKEGERLIIHFENRGSKQHTIHFHGIHPGNMDGVFELVPPGGTFDYEFDAEPYGIFPFHCHMMPLRKHVSRGLFGTLIIDPAEGRDPATEMIMVMHGLDVDLDMENEFYAINGFVNYYRDFPINLKVGEKVRIYLSNMTEFDLVNNFHLHANMFHYYPNGTTMVAAEFTDTINLCQGQRGIIEFEYKFPGTYMFHAHTAEFAELGWLGLFDVTE